MREKYICKNCGYIGTFGLEALGITLRLILLLFFATAATIISNIITSNNSMEYWAPTLINWSVFLGFLFFGTILTFNERRKDCPQCKEKRTQIKLNSKYGKKLESDFKLHTTQNQIINQDTKECPFCAETIKAKAILCRYCGKEI